MSKVMTKTTKFDNMLQAFECDFDLALQGEKTLSELQANIANGDERILQDIELLKELAYLIRSGRAEIRVLVRRLWCLSFGNGNDARFFEAVIDGVSKVVAFESETDAYVALGNLQKSGNFNYKNVISFEVAKQGHFSDSREYHLMKYENGIFR